MNRLSGGIYTEIPLRKFAALSVTTLAPMILGSVSWIHAQSQSAPASETPAECSVSGIVVDSVSGVPLTKADIWLEPLGGPNPSAAGGVAMVERLPIRVTARSDSKGRFDMVGLEPGTYSLKARRSGYLDGAHGTRRPGSTGSRLELKAGQSLTDLRIRLTPGAAISGSVRDSDGELIEGARVKLSRLTYEDGIPAVRTVSATETDDRGEYRFHGLEGGRYYVAVEPARQFGEADRSAEIGAKEGPVWTLYPGVRDLALAMPIDAIPGRRLSGVDVSLVRAQLFRVRGRVEDQRADSPMVVELTDTKNASLRRVLQTRTGVSGDFEFPGVPPGSYGLRVMGAGSVAVVVDVADVDGLRIRFAPGPARMEKLQITTEYGAAADLPEISLLIASEGLGHRVESGQRGSRTVPPGHYSVARFFGTPLGEYYVKTARAGNVDILTEGFTAASGGQIQITAVLARDGAKIEGVVRNDREPAAGADVVLAPDDRSRICLFRSTKTDQYGRYEFPAVPPGNYKLFALDDPEPEIWYDPNFLGKYEKQGSKATLESNGRKVIELGLAVRPDAE